MVLDVYYCCAAVCEHAYTMAQNLDPDSEGRGVLQFKTGLMSVIKVLPFMLLLLEIMYLRTSTCSRNRLPILRTAWAFLHCISSFLCRQRT